MTSVTHAPLASRLGRIAPSAAGEFVRDALVVLALLGAFSLAGWVLGGWMLYADVLSLAAGRL